VTAAAVTTRTYPHTTVIALRGEIGESLAPQLRHALAETLVRRRPRRIVVDLNGVTALDATAIGVLLGAQDSAVDLHVVLAVRRANQAMAADLAGHGLPVVEA
jgi:anti-anti-sigma factor